MSINTWITTTSNTLISLKEDIALLDDLLRIEDRIAAFRRLEVEDAFDLLALLVAGPDPDQEQALAAIGIEADALRALGRRFLANLDEQDIEEFQQLLSSFTQLASMSPEQPAERVWPLLDESREGERQVPGNLALRMNAAIGLRMALQPLAALPPGVAPDAHKHAVLKLALAGQLIHGSSFGLAGRGSRLDGSLEGAGSAAIEFYFRHLPNRRVGDALLIDLRRLTSPFSVGELQQRLVRENLSALRLRVNHRTRLSGKVGLTRDLDVGDWLIGKAGVGATFDFRKTLAGDFEYLVHSDGAGNLVVKIRRLAEAGKQSTATLDLSLDLSGWAQRVYPQIRDRLGQLGELVQEVEPLLPGQSEFRDLLSGALAEQLGDFPHKTEVLQGLGLIDGGEPLGTRFEEALLDRIESSRKLWTGSLASRADEVTAELINGLPVSADLRNKLNGPLGKALTKGLGRLDKSLDERLGALLKGRQYKAVVEKLNRLGHRVDEGLRSIGDRVAAVTGPLREELDGLQQRLNSLKGLFNDASKAKILMALSAMMREQKSDELDLNLVIDPDHDDAQKVLDELFGADIDGLFSRLFDDEGHPKPPGSSAILQVDGSSTRYASMFDQRGFATVLFGYGLSGQTTLSAEARMVVDAHGNIQILSKGEFAKAYKSLHDERELQIVDVMELASAGRNNSVSLSTQLSMTDEDLKPGEVKAFFRSAEKAGLLMPGTADRAVAGLDDSQLKAGRLDVGMSLSREQLWRMLGIDRPQGGLAQQSPVNAERVFGIASRNMAEICTAQPPTRDLIDRLEMLRRELPGFGVDLGGDLASMIDGMTRERRTEAAKWLEHLHGERRDEVFNSQRALAWVEARRVAVLGCHGSCTGAAAGGDDGFRILPAGPGQTRNEQFGLLDAIEGMRKACFALQSTPRPDVAELRRQQTGIAHAFKSWFVWQEDFPRWWMLNAKEIRPLTLAFFKTLGELAMAPDDARPLLSAAITLKGPQGEDKKRIPLTD